MNQSPRTEAWVEIARASDEHDFLSRYPGFFLLAGEEAEEFAITEETRIADFAAVPSSRKRIPSFEVRWIASPQGAGIVTVGREDDCDVVFRDHTVSKIHAQFCNDRRGLTITDLNSRNGTRLNQRALVPEQPEPVSSHDHLEFGTVKTMVIDTIEMRILLSRLA
jgi:FHA domain